MSNVNCIDCPVSDFCEHKNAYAEYTKILSGLSETLKTNIDIVCGYRQTRNGNNNYSDKESDEKIIHYEDIF